MKKYLLKSNIVAEPLIADWYAWSHLLSPVTGAMLISRQYLKILKSYFKSPNVHREAVRSFSLRGGPFLDDEQKNRIKEVELLIKKIENEYGDLIKFAEDFQQLSSLLKIEKKGMSLASLYTCIPENLKGFVELVYDIYNNPSFRLIEPLIYKSDYYKSDLQSVMLTEFSGYARPFVLSSPRFNTEKSLTIKRPFSDSIFDELFSMRTESKTMDEIEKIFGNKIINIEKKLFLNFFFEQDSKVKSSNIGFRIKYFGHACILIESRVNILIDPLIGYKNGGDISCYTYEDLPDVIDYVLITHAHPDHFVTETLLQIRYKIKNIVVPRNLCGNIQDPSLALVLKNLGFKNIISLDEFDILTVGDCKIMGIPFFGEHADLNIQSKLAYLIETPSKTILCAADSDNLEPKLYAHIKKIVPKIDIIFLGMECDGAPLSWLYGYLYSGTIPGEINCSRRLNGSDYEKAINLIQTFECNSFYIYAMGAEPWLQFITSIEYEHDSKPIIESNKVIQYCKANNVNSKRLFGSECIYE